MKKRRWRRTFGKVTADGVKKLPAPSSKRKIERDGTVIEPKR
jgi:hypothetical protein